MPAADPLVTAFSFRRSLLDGSGEGALDVLESTVGVYAANPSGPLSIRVRAPAVTPAEVLALEPAAAERTRAMRTSAFLVPRRTAPLIRAATAQPLDRFAWMLRAAGVTQAQLPDVRARVRAAANVPVTARDLRVLAGLGDVAISPLLSYLSMAGDLRVLGPGSVTSNASRYVAADPGAEQDAAPAGESARAWLAGAYLRGFGPVRVDDLAWWAGWSRSHAVAALAAHDTVDVGGGLLLAAEDVDAFERPAPAADRVTLLPKWDPWTMGYPQDGRERFVDRDVHDRLFDGDGNGLGAILVNGRAVGAWGHRGVGRRMEARVDLFDGRVAGASLRSTIEAELASIAAFLGYRDLRVVDAATVVPDRPRVRKPLA